jgi:hypothetical protein
MTKTTQPPGPFAAPPGSTPETYAVTIRAIIPNAHTDPSLWDFGALLETIEESAHLLTDIVSVRLVAESTTEEPSPSSFDLAVQAATAMKTINELESK